MQKIGYLSRCFVVIDELDRLAARLYELMYFDSVSSSETLSL